MMTRQRRSAFVSTLMLMCGHLEGVSAPDTRASIGLRCIAFDT
jgi:hypothetical protein